MSLFNLFSLNSDVNWCANKSFFFSFLFIRGREKEDFFLGKRVLRIHLSSSLVCTLNRRSVDLNYFSEFSQKMECNQTQSSNSDDYKYLFEAIQTMCGLYLIPILCIPGLIGNILCIIVFVTNNTERFLTTQSLIFLAVADTIKLFNDLLYSLVLIVQTVNQEIGKKIFLMLYRYCHYINTVSTLNTAWLTLIIAIER